MRSDSDSNDILQDPIVSTSSLISTLQSAIPTISTNPMDISQFVKQSFNWLRKIWCFGKCMETPCGF